MRSQDQHFQPQQQDNQQSKVFYELSAMILNILRSPPTPFDFPDDVTSASGVGGGQSSAIGVVGRRQQMGPMGSLGMGQITPAGFASLLLGISLALMLCGSVTFFIGFMLMPWVVGLVMVFYFVGLISSLSVLGRAILCHGSSPPPCCAPFSPRKDCSSWKFS